LAQANSQHAGWAPMQLPWPTKPLGRADDVGPTRSAQQPSSGLLVPLLWVLPASTVRIRVMAPFQWQLVW